MTTCPSEMVMSSAPPPTWTTPGSRISPSCAFLTGSLMLLLSASTTVSTVKPSCWRTPTTYLGRRPFVRPEKRARSESREAAQTPIPTVVSASIGLACLASADCFFGLVPLSATRTSYSTGIDLSPPSRPAEGGFIIPLVALEPGFVRKRPQRLAKRKYSGQILPPSPHIIRRPCSGRSDGHPLPSGAPGSGALP